MADAANAASTTVEAPDATAATTSGSQHANQPPCFLILYNIAKRHNVGNIARSASAFGVAQLCLVGSRHFSAFGAHGAENYVKFAHFTTLEDCCRHLKEKEGCHIVGVEIMDSAQPVHSHPFCGPTAFMIGNEGHGLSKNQVALCDAFVYIPQYGDGTASLNVTVATSIVLQHFAQWAGYHEHRREGQKFVVGQRPQRTAPRGMVARSADEEAAERQRRQKKQQANGSLLDGEEGSSDQDGSAGTLGLFDGG